jgi:hypothetical protein
MPASRVSGGGPLRSSAARLRYWRGARVEVRWPARHAAKAAPRKLGLPVPSALPPALARIATRKICAVCVLLSKILEHFGSDLVGQERK